MSLKSLRANEIKTYIDTHKNSKLGVWPIEVSGVVESLSFYKLPIKILRYSVDNGRFAAEKIAREVELKRSLDPNNPDDIKQIKNLLLDAEPEATEKFKKDISEKGQLYPGVITVDGYVKNGNRRMAIIDLLHDETPSAKWEYLNVILLPESVSEEDLWRIEANLQLSQDSKLDYGPINEMLKIKEGFTAGLTASEMAQAMYGWTVDRVNDALERLELINQYLDYFHKVNEYKKIDNEYFINLQNNLKSWRKAGIDNYEINERIEMVFLYINNSEFPDRKTSHMDVRVMRDIFDNPKANKVFYGSQSKENHNLNTKKTSAELAYEGFKEAKDIVDIEKEKIQPKQLLKKAISVLEGLLEISSSNKNFYVQENQILLRRIKNIIEEIDKNKATNG